MQGHEERRGGRKRENLVKKDVFVMQGKMGNKKISIEIERQTGMKDMGKE